MSLLYTTSATATGGRTGRASIDDGTLSLPLVTPRELGGPGGEGTNPEQLFACGYAACFLSTLRFVAGRRKLTLADNIEVQAVVGIGSRADGGGFGLQVGLTVTIPGMNQKTATELVDEAHIVCPYSHLAREGIAVRLTIA